MTTISQYKALAICFVILLTTACSLQPKTPYVKDVIYGHKDGMALTYDAFLPKKPNGAGIIYMVSGGWFSIWKKPEERLVYFSPMLNEGFTVFAVHHGSAPRFKVPDAVSDVRAAVRHIYKKSKLYKVDPSRLGVFGGSAGGHLSLMLGLNSEGLPNTEPYGPRKVKPYYDSLATDKAELAAVVAYYPPVDLRNRVGPNERYPSLDFDPKAAKFISPILYVTENDPPTLLVHGTQDKVVPLDDSQLLKTAFENKHVQHQLVVIEGGDHGFSVPEHRLQATTAMVNWFNKHLN